MAAGFFWKLIPGNSINVNGDSTEMADLAAGKQTCKIHNHKNKKSTKAHRQTTAGVLSISEGWDSGEPLSEPRNRRVRMDRRLSSCINKKASKQSELITPQSDDRIQQMPRVALCCPAGSRTPWSDGETGSPQKPHVVLPPHMGEEASLSLGMILIESTYVSSGYLPNLSFRCLRLRHGSQHATHRRPTIYCDFPTAPAKAARL